MDGCLKCPHDACQKRLAYKTKQNLLRHYGIRKFTPLTIGPFTDILMVDVACNEVCVFCCMRFEQTNKLLRHVEECHKHEVGRKAQFMDDTCSELASIVSEELHAAQHRQSSSSTNPRGKRTRVVSDIDSGAFDTERARKARIIDNGDQIVQAATQSSSSRQPTAAFMGLHTMEEINGVDMNGMVNMENMAMNGVVNMSSMDINAAVVMDSAGMDRFDRVSSELIYPNQAENLGDIFYAPILQMVSAPASFQ